MIQKYDKLLDSIRRTIQLSFFQKYILQSHEHSNQLIFNIRTAKTASTPRFNVWRLLLEILPFDESYQHKIEKLEGYRKHWQALKDESRSMPKNASKEGPLGVSRNPLMKGPIKTQKKQVSDSFLTQEIKKDVTRTYQEMKFFQEETIIKLMMSVLFVWCKANPEVSYRQGMNELLASIVWVYFHEAVPSNYHANNEIQKKYQAFNCVKHAEADIFIVFQKIMDIQKEMFKENFDSQVKGVINPNSKNNSPILQRIGHLQDHRLKHLDLQLYRAFKLQDVKTKTFLLRWIKCMHTREFGLEGSLPIWDSIILEHYESVSSGRARKQFEFSDALCLSMFIYMRSRVLTMESTNEILQVYQKYPQLEGESLQELLGLAWSVCEELRKEDGKSSEDNNEPKSNKKVEEKQTKKEIPKQTSQVTRKGSIAISAKKQSDPKNQISRKIQIDSLELQALIDKLSKSNTCNQNIDSKKLVKSVIQSLQSMLNL